MAVPDVGRLGRPRDRNGESPNLGGRMNIGRIAPKEGFFQDEKPPNGAVPDNRDQDRYVMITFPTHRFKIPFFLAGPRSATVALVQICLATSTSPSIFLAYRRFPHLRPTNHAPQRRQPKHSSASVAPHARPSRANLHSARRSSERWELQGKRLRKGLSSRRFEALEANDRLRAKIISYAQNY
jgi:hypothetical protein